jgi:arsenate reductase (glutaredoxin)
MTVVYHNPNCSTSRKALEQIRERGIEPRIVLYLKNPPDRATLERIVADVGGGARAVLRKKEKLADELGLNDPSVGDPALIDAMLAHPALIERPIVVTPKGTRVCRPLEKLAEVL